MVNSTVFLDLHTIDVIIVRVYPFLNKGCTVKPNLISQVISMRNSTVRSKRVLRQVRLYKLSHHAAIKTVSAITNFQRSSRDRKGE